MDKCIVCHKNTAENESYFKCCECGLPVHSQCLSSVLHLPDVLLGDVFYKYNCVKCSCTGSAQLKRERLSWLQVVVLTLYNLQELQDRVSHHGYFHWKFHILHFIDKNWTTFFGRNVKKKRSWRGTVSGTLSHYSPTFFKTGSEILNESGWWRLAMHGTPQYIIQRHANFIQESKKGGGSLEANELMLLDSEPPIETSGMNSLNLPQDILSFIDDKESLSSRSALDLDILNFTDTESLDVDVDISVDEEDEKIIRGDLNSDFNIFDSAYGYNDLHTDIEIKREAANSPMVEIKKGIKSVGDVGAFPVSLFTRRPNANSSTWPWESQESTFCPESFPRSEYEELELLSRLSRCIDRRKNDVTNIPKSVNRLYRRLKVRQHQRHRRLKLFDRELRQLCGVQSEQEHLDNFRMLDRYQNVSWATMRNEPQSTKQQPFIVRLLGHVEPPCFVSPYTDRLLKPFIRRDCDSKPLWLRLMEEVRAAANKRNPKWRPPPTHPIDFCYVRPHHIPAINSLCQLFFWPGIDLTESLHYPDFSCVALYRKLVVGFAFMLPVSYTETYISFLFTRPEWRKAGIASFMLYHLIQTCMGKDVTLHVSATNPALLLYQKFGFKVEEFVQDFYDKYLPPNSRECKHALFLRLSR